MDFLDSLDQQTPPTHEKTDRMRSWYLYEQYKTLEQHQLDAAQVLRNRSVQDRLLHQELTERRARRNLFDQVSTYRSEPKLNRSQATCLSTTTDDFYESFCELHDFEADKDSLDSHHGSNTFMEDFKTLDEFEEDTSCVGSVSSVVDKEPPDRSVQRTITENIKLHLQTVKENMVSLERYTRMADGERTSEASVDSLGWPKPTNVLHKDVDDNQLFYMWSRLVAFAYHIIQLNHGNCYYDYSSQLLTAVLACDALRRGVNRMCDILQYYVSPVNYASDSEDRSTNYNKKHKKKKSHVSKKVRKSSKYKINSSLHKKDTKHSRSDHHHAERSKYCWQCHANYLFANKMQRNEKKNRLRRREWLRAKRRSVPSTLWPEDMEAVSSRHSHHASNPMLMLVRYLDDVLKTDVQDFTCF